jgi:flagellar basal body P-ring protein FlgI
VGIPQNIETMEFILDQADFTNAKRVTNALNKSFGRPIALPVDGRSVRLSVPRTGDSVMIPDQCSRSDFEVTE